MKMIINDLEHSKFICLHGIKITDILCFKFKVNEEEINITFVPYCEFVHLNIIDKIINRCDIVECDIVIIIDNMGNNTAETQLIKTAISILYFAFRMKISASMKFFVENECFGGIKIPKEYNDFFENYHLNGFKSSSGIICHTIWIIGLGKCPINNDDYESLLTRGYGQGLDVLYDRRDEIERMQEYVDSTIEVDESLKSIISKICDKINKNDLYSRKLLSTFRLYYEIMCEYKSPANSIISACTILETLLLSDDEDNQRKKASARAACIIANRLSLHHKRFVANNVYLFYKYRNKLVHDGAGIMDFDEVIWLSVMTKIKHIIFSIILYVVNEDIVSAEQIKDMVKSNMDNDRLDSSFDYIDYQQIDNNNSVPIMIFEEDYI